MSALITDSVRVLLLVMARSMTEQGFVSVPRKVLAAALNRDERRITERLETARKIGFLSVVRQGMPGRTAEYAAAFPILTERVRTGAPSAYLERVRTGAPEKGADCSAHSLRTGAPSNAPSHGADGQPTNTRASVTEPCALCGMARQLDEHRLCDTCALAERERTMEIPND